MEKIEHNHYMDGQYHFNCPRCKINEAAPDLLEACQQIAEHRVLIMDDEGETEADAMAKVAQAAIVKAEKGE